MNRRDLLKLFGVGATVVPVISGVPEIAAPAKLVEPARVEPVRFEPVSEVWNMRAGEEWYISVDAVQNGQHVRFAARSFVLNQTVELIRPEMFTRVPVAPILGRQEIRWVLEGVAIGPVAMSSRSIR